MSRRALVTGASRGIGQYIALHLARDGFDIAIHCKNHLAGAEETADLVRQQCQKAHILSFDVGDREETRKALEEDIKAQGVYYGVVCNAGIHKDNAFPAIPSEDWDSVINTNLSGFYNVLHPIVMPMVRAKKGGRIVVMSSVSGLMGNRGQVNYSAAKGGLIAASKALAIELAKRQITVNCVAPGIIETDMTKNVPHKYALDMIPARRFGQPHEVASLVAYLFSDAAGYITRQTISVNGGMV